MHAFLRNFPTCWCHSLTLRHVSKTHILYNQPFTVFSAYHSKLFLLILLSLQLIKHYWPFGHHWHICFMSTIKVKMQTRFMVLFTSGSLLTWGNLQVASPSISPRYLPAIYSSQLYPSVFYRHHTMTEYAFFAEKADRWGKDMASLWGNFNICPQLHQLELPCHFQAELFSISGLKV